MKQFDVLHRSLELQQNYLLEASAGTGKTFSIQHLVVRLLIGSIALPEILVVTFTRESTRILKSRIRRNIDDAIAFLTQPDLESIPDYLAHVIEQGEPAATQAKKRLQEALFVFDQAQIFTIHSFCARMLNQFSMESGTNFHSKCSEDPLHDGELIQIINDYFRSEVVPGKYSRSLLELYLKEDPYRKKL
jgi:exodeoxyribonuclease V beta subunit